MSTQASAASRPAPPSFLPGAAPDSSRRACLVALASLGATWTLPVPSAGSSFYDNFAGMQLLDQAGQPLRLTSLLGKVVLFNFIFTACSTVCPVQTHALAQMQQRMTPGLRTRVHLVSVSLDPLGDTPRTLSTFASRYQVDHAHWSFTTGRPADIEHLAGRLALFRQVKGSAPLEDHATSLWLADAGGVLRMRYAGNPPDVVRIERELSALAALSDMERLQPTTRRSTHPSP